MMSLIFLMASATAAGQLGGYECRVTVIAKDLTSGVATQTIHRPYSTGESHGGSPTELTFGEHKVGIAADSKWRGIIWQRAGKDVAQVLTTGTEPILGNHVMILYNPANLDEQVNMVCDPNLDEFPKE